MKTISKEMIRQLRKLHLKKHRDQNGLYIAEGMRSLQAALNSVSAKIQSLIVSLVVAEQPEIKKLINRAVSGNIPVFTCNEKEFRQISDEVSPSGLLFSIEKTSPSTLQQLSKTSTNIAYLEQASDPGNLGTIIRSAAWFGLDALLLSPQSVDPYNPKVVRATAGTIFDIDIVCYASLDEMIRIFKPAGFCFHATVPAEKTDSIIWQPKDKNVVFLGPEAHGLSAEAIGKCDDSITITGSGNTESLNVSVSAGILFYELTHNKINQG